jgi:hypothetical protein
MATTKWLLHSRRRWRYECRLLVQPGHTLIISSLFFVVFMTSFFWYSCMSGHFTPSWKHFQCMHNKKTKIWFLIRGSHGSFLMKILPIMNQTKHPTKGGGKATRWKGPQVLANEQPSNGGGWCGGGKGTRLKEPSPGKWTTLQWGWMVWGWKRYKIEGPKSWQMRNPPKRVDRQGNRNKSSTQTCLPASLLQWWKAYQIIMRGGRTPFFHFYRQVKDPEWFRLGQICTFVAKFPWQICTEFWLIFIPFFFLKKKPNFQYHKIEKRKKRKQKCERKTLLMFAVTMKWWITTFCLLTPTSQIDEAVNQLQLQQTERPIFFHGCVFLSLNKKKLVLIVMAIAPSSMWLFSGSQRVIALNGFWQFEMLNLSLC